MVDFSRDLENRYFSCCKLSKQKQNNIQLANEGTNDWKVLNLKAMKQAVGT